MELLLGVFSAFGLSASAGLNAYIPLMVIALLARYTDLIKLAEPFDLLANPWVMVTIGVLIIVEFLADKVPAVNHINDAIQTLVRPTAGAIAFAAAAGVITEVSPVLSLILGLGVAGTVHAAKSMLLRPAVTAATGGAGNVPVSIAEDIVSTVMSVLAVVLPVIIASIIIMLTALFVFWLWRKARQNT
jgi:hypothetical protein